MSFLTTLLRRCFLPAAAGSVALMLASCASYKANLTRAGSEYSPAPPSAATRSSDAAAVERRPGLGTKAGWETYDRVDRTAFYRRSNAPDAVASFHYNDGAGAKAMADMLGSSTRRSGLFETAGGRLRAGLVSYGSDAFPRLEAKGRQIVMGNPGSDYQIRLENTTKHRLEVLVSVDSLNVLTGNVAAYRQRGYVLAPRQTVNIQGFRVNDTKVKRFEFSSVAASLATQKGQARNVGVIGLAVFEEDEAKAAMKLRQEQFQREDASAFPMIGL